MKIRVKFNEKQYIEVVFISPNNRKLEKCHAYYIAKEGRTSRGLFGTIYIRNDWTGAKLKGLLDHELQHFYHDWIDEQVATLAGAVSEAFWIRYDEKKV